MRGKDQKREADRIFDAAMDLDPAERRALLDRECGSDSALRARVERLLDHVDATVSRELGTAGAFGMLPPTTGANEPMPDLCGQTLGRYRIEREIGRGGMGVVYEALDERLKRHVAIKVLSTRRSDPRVQQRFLNEAQSAAQLNHPNIVAIHDAGEADGWPFLVMEQVEGRDLDEVEPASLDEAIDLAKQICDALTHAHGKGLVHRDLKPGNVLVVGDRGNRVAKLADMGIALAGGATRVTQTGAVTGTPAYMAPEQALGQSVDARTDLYSLGVMLYDWVTGRMPFLGDDALAVVSQHIHAPVVPPRTYCPEIPVGLEAIVLRLLAKSPEDRFPSAAAVREAIDAIDRADIGDVAVSIEGLTRGRLVNRRDELDLLKSFWANARQGKSHLALISGEPGVGKTRLAQEILSMARLDGALVIHGGCYENEATAPYLPFVEAFRRLVSERNDDQLKSQLDDTAAELARLAPEIESRLGPFAERPKLAPQEERLRLFDAIARFLRRLAEPAGLMFFFDDLQWADHGSLGLLRYLLRQLPDDRVLFLGTYREVELDRAHPLSKSLVDWDRERLATRIRLDRLNADDTHTMIRTLLGQTEISGELADRVRQETEGNPFFVEEILKALIAEGGLVRERSSWTGRKTSSEFVLPQSVKAAVGSRLEHVSGTCSDVLRTAAVLGKVFDFSELEAIARQDEDEILDALDEAVRAHLIVAGTRDSFRFTHDKIREVLYEELNPIRRRRVHARIAEGLQALQDGGRTVSVEDLAHHYVESGDYENGLTYADRAATAASSLFAYDEALAMLDRAYECADALERPLDQLRIEETRGDVAFAKGNIPFAVERFERVIERTADNDQRNRVRAKCAEAYCISGDPRGLDHASLALESLDPTREPEITAQAMTMEARYAHLRGDLDTAVEVYREALKLTETGKDRELHTRLLSFLAGSLQHLADFENSDEVSRRCIEVGESENIPGGVMLGLEFLQENAFYRGSWEASVEFGEREEELAVETRSGERFGWAQFRALALHRHGRLDAARAVLKSGIEHSRRTGDIRCGLFLEATRALVLMETGRLDQALEFARDVLRRSEEADLLFHRFCALGYLVEVHLRRGETRAAMEVARQALDLAEPGGMPGLTLIYGAVCAEGLVRGGETRSALPVLEHHEELARRTSADHRIAQNERVRALIDIDEGRPEDALRRLDEVIDTLERCKSRLDLSVALLDRAGLHETLGNAALGIRDREESRRLREECGASPLP